MIIAPYVHKWEGGGIFHPVLIYYVMVKIILGTKLSYDDHHIATCALVVGGRREIPGSRSAPPSLVTLGHTSKMILILLNLLRCF